MNFLKGFKKRLKWISCRLKLYSFICFSVLIIRIGLWYVMYCLPSTWGSFQQISCNLDFLHRSFLKKNRLLKLNDWFTIIDNWGFWNFEMQADLTLFVFNLIAKPKQKKKLRLTYYFLFLQRTWKIESYNIQHLFVVDWNILGRIYSQTEICWCF